MRRIVIRFTTMFVMTVLAIAMYLGIQLYFGNMHEVVKGELFRSAQLEPGDLTGYSKKYHIATVLNLRGPNPSDDWYKDEVKEAAELGITHIDFPMKASRELTDEQAVRLIQLMRDAPKPLLIHCRSGADRTGLASAIYVAAIAKQGEWAAERQLWLNYGHLSLYFNGAFAMNRSFERLEPLFGWKDS